MVWWIFFFLLGLGGSGPECFTVLVLHFVESFKNVGVDLIIFFGTLGDERNARLKFGLAVWGFLNFWSETLGENF